MWLCILKAIVYTFIMFLFTRNMVKVERYTERDIKFNIGQIILFFIVSLVPILGEMIFLICVFILTSNFIEGINKSKEGYYEYITIKEGKSNFLYGIAKLLKTEI